jgi:cysteine-rich repeat protein
VGDVCQNGTCVAGTPVTCTASDQCHVAGVCNPQTGLCSNPPANNGTACSDGSLCTLNDSCQSGVCVGTPKTCTASDQCHVAGTCNPSDGSCSDPAANDGTSCNDGNPCTQTDTCQGGQCVGGNPVVCTALDQCHDPGVCDVSSGQCSNPTKQNGSGCDNPNDLCNQTHSCQGGVCTGGNPVVCSPLDQCHLAGTCTAGQCSNPTKPDNSSCNDQNPCTQTDTCQGGSCVGGNPVVCTALDQCHDPGVCDVSTGQCSNPNSANGTGCDDSNACTQTDTCQGGVCTGGNPVVCHPLDQCHVAGVCDQGSGICSNPNANDGTTCTDNDGCTVGDQCVNGACQPGGPKDCSDPNPCTDDSCSSPSGTCIHTFNTDPCTNTNACQVDKHCSEGHCLGLPKDCDDGNPCTDNGCDSATGCFVTYNNDPCDDGNACTVGDKCSGGTCQPGTAKICDDNNPCTDDTCDVQLGCIHVPNNAPCDDGNACTVGDACANGECQPGQPRICDDHNPCTDDGCNSATGCFVVNNTHTCNDANACTTGDHCVAGSCVGGPPPNCNDNNACTLDSCDSVLGCQHALQPNCQPCQTNADCQDGTVCDGTEKCVNGMCTSGTPLHCNDNNDCTDDSCDPVNGCTFTPNTHTCDDGNACTTNDACSGGHCVGGPPPDCNNHNVCTTDTCDPAKGCVHTPNTAFCDDGNPCTTGDQCKGGTCVGGPKPNCDDGNPCTDDSCDPTVVGGCVHQDNTATCDDGNPCTMNDVCSEGHCAGSPRTCDDNNPCTIDQCDDQLGQFLCVNTDCHNLPGNVCPPGCEHSLCGDGIIEANLGETCDPPDPTPIPGVTPPQPKCRTDCTFCGDGIVQDGESCDDGNTVSGCDPQHLSKPLDMCQNNCTPPICHDPAVIVEGPVLGRFSMHGLMATTTPVDLASNTFVFELTDATFNQVLYRNSLEAESLVQVGLVPDNTFKYNNRLARVLGGIAKVRVRRLKNGYRITAMAVGNFNDVIDHMVTHVFSGTEEWTVSGHWRHTGPGWRFGF